MANMNVIDSISYSKGGIVSKIIFKGEKNQITLFSMAAGTDISKHTSTKEGYLYVLEGKGVFNLAGKDIAMKAGAIIHITKNMKHSLKAEKNTSYLLVLTE